jgi:hypothetical protein
VPGAQRRQDIKNKKLFLTYLIAGLFADNDEYTIFSLIADSPGGN